MTQRPVASENLLREFSERFIPVQTPGLADTTREVVRGIFAAKPRFTRRPQPPAVMPVLFGYDDGVEIINYPADDTVTITYLHGSEPTCCVALKDDELFWADWGKGRSPAWLLDKLTSYHLSPPVMVPFGIVHGGSVQTITFTAMPEFFFLGKALAKRSWINAFVREDEEGGLTFPLSLAGRGYAGVCDGMWRLIHNQQAVRLGRRLNNYRTPVRYQRDGTTGQIVFSTSDSKRPGIGIAGTRYADWWVFESRPGELPRPYGIEGMSAGDLRGWFTD